MSEKYKTVQVRLATYEKLANMSNVTDSFDSVISSLIKKIEWLQSAQLGYHGEIVTNAMVRPAKEEHNCG